MSKEVPLVTLILKTVGLTFFFLGIFLILTGLSLGLYAYSQFNTFLTAAGVSRQEVLQTARTAWHAQPKTDHGHVRFLLLGVDSLPTRGEVPPLTDTMSLIDLNVDTARITIVSIPRDLWHEDYRTKINALYAYGFDRDPNHPTTFPTQVVEELTQISLDHTFVLSLDQVSHLVDILGGIEINVPEGFTDHEFPRPDVDIRTEHDPAKLYETVTFETGLQTMDGPRALKYIRSRKAEGDQGTDDARSVRQLQVMLALIHKIEDRSVMTNPEIMGRLYRFYLDTFDQEMPVVEVLALAKKLYPHRSELQIQSHVLSIFPENPNGVIVHPPVTEYNGQWVYTVRDDQAFKKEITNYLEK